MAKQLPMKSQNYESVEWLLNSKIVADPDGLSMEGGISWRVREHEFIWGLGASPPVGSRGKALG